MHFTEISKFKHWNRGHIFLCIILSQINTQTLDTFTIQGELICKST